MLQIQKNSNISKIKKKAKNKKTKMDNKKLAKYNLESAWNISSIDSFDEINYVLLLKFDDQ
jgi:hypothetical protein